MFVLQISNETASRWSQLEEDTVVELQEECLSMTIKGITRTCFGSVFNNDEEIHKMNHLYHQVLTNNLLCTNFFSRFYCLETYIIA